MTLLQSWKDSILFFQPKYFKLFALVTVKSLIEAYKLLFKYWWWLFVLVAATAYATVYASYYAEQYYFYAQWAHIILRYLLFFAVCLVTRPSMEKKTCAYFRTYFPYFGYVVASLLILIRTQYSIMPYAGPLYIFCLLFFLDSDKKLKQLLFALFRGFKMFIYNYPLYFILFFGFVLFRYVVMLAVAYFFILFAGQLFTFFNGRAALVIQITQATSEIIDVSFLMPLMICMFANIYIKKLHEQFDIYFKQPK